MHGRDEKCIKYFLFENQKGRNHAEDISVVGRITLKWIFGK
jgi:hypothetical protein